MNDLAADLLNELNGLDGGPSVEVVDAPTQPPAPALAMEVAPPIAVSPSAKLDAVHATKSGGQGYALKIVGDFFIPAPLAPGKKTLLPYEVSVNVPSLTAALSTIIKTGILDAAVKRKYASQGYLRFRTHHIESATPLSPSTPESNNLQYMPREGLLRYIAQAAAPITAELYPKTEDLREVVLDFHQNPLGFDKREGERQAKRVQRAELAALNPGLV